MSAGLPNGLAGGLVGDAIENANSIIEASATLIVPSDQLQILAALAGRGAGLNGSNSTLDAEFNEPSPIKPN
ncbi:MAG: hypothetical protein ACRCWO_12165 [Bosea sp. (in: a-proteobacteria)]